jgi:hypothetical protein
MDALKSICQPPPSELESSAGHPSTNTPERASGSTIGRDVRGGEWIAATGISAHDPAEWREPVIQWIESNCLLRARDFGSFFYIYRAFQEWMIADGDVPCTAGTFKTLLEELDFLIADGFVAGLILRSDFEAHERFNQARE